MRLTLSLMLLVVAGALPACADAHDNRPRGDSPPAGGDGTTTTGDTRAGDTTISDGDPAGDRDEAGEWDSTGDDTSGDNDTNSGDDMMADQDNSGDQDLGPRTIVRVHYDTGVGNSITLRGQGPGLSWATDTPTTWTSGNVWEFSTTLWDTPVELKPMYLAGGGAITWAPGPNWIARPGQTLDIYPFFFSTSGRIDSITVNGRPVALYLPPSYDEAGAHDRRYPVLLMHDGQNLFDPDAIGGGWHVDETMNQLLVWGNTETSDGWTDLGGVTEVIIVAPYNTTDRIYEYTPSNASYGGCDATSETCGGGADDYLDFLLTVVRPAVDLAYRTRGTMAGIAGSSLGGLVSLYACWTRPASFDRCGVFSPSLWWDDEALLLTIEAYAGVHTGGAYYLDAGTISDGLAETQRLAAALQDPWTPYQDLVCLAGVDMEHNEAAWRYRAPWALHFLYQDPDRVQAHPQLPSDLYSCVD